MSGEQQLVAEFHFLTHKTGEQTFETVFGILIANLISRMNHSSAISQYSCILENYSRCCAAIINEGVASADQQNHVIFIKGKAKRPVHECIVLHLSTRLLWNCGHVICEGCSSSAAFQHQRKCTQMQEYYCHEWRDDKWVFYLWFVHFTFSCFGSQLNELNPHWVDCRPIKSSFFRVPINTYKFLASQHNGECQKEKDFGQFFNFYYDIL